LAAVLVVGLGPAPRAGEALAPDARALADKFSGVGYGLAGVRDGVAVPRLFLTGLPPDLAAVPSARQRKGLFLRSLLPLVLRANEALWAKRERMLDLARRLDDGEEVSWSERAWLTSLAEEFGLASDDFEGLRRRVDIIPPALALAQAAAESGWGTSRFARLGNAVFGQRTWARGDGLVPGRRDRDKRHEVKKFLDLKSSVAAYVMNLNRHPAYRAFRAERQEMRQGGELDSLALVGTLARYAEDGRGYLETLKSIIRVNRLLELDRAQLAPSQAVPAANPDAGV
jgi:Bax protein